MRWRYIYEMPYAILIISYLSFSNVDASQIDKFSHAMPEEIWVIGDSNIPLLKKPTTHEDINAFKLNLVMVINPDKAGATIVVIIENKGWLDPWKKVVVVDENGNPKATGWIVSSVVKNAIKYK